MSNFLNYSPEELAQDSFFISWVKSPDLSTETYWRDFLETYPFKKEDVEVARHLVLFVYQVGDYEVNNQDVKEVKEAVFSRIEALESETKYLTISRRWYWSAAAFLLLGLVVLGWYLNGKFINQPTISYENQVKNAASRYEIVEVINPSQTPKIINLPDGSSVVLKKGSKLSYPQQFTAQFREVFLSGEAFFEIAKNPNAPFFVKTSQITTKVLGTSFNVKAFENDEKAIVSVKTGKVAVFLSSKAEQAQNAANKLLEGLVLKTGEKAVFERETLHQVEVQERIAEASTLPPIEEQSFEFEEIPLREVFAILERAYQVDIEFDDAQMGSCMITASLTDVPFSEKLKLVSMAVRAKYHEQNGKIYIKGEGCK